MLAAVEAHLFLRFVGGLRLNTYFIHCLLVGVWFLLFAWRFAVKCFCGGRRFRLNGLSRVRVLIKQHRTNLPDVLQTYFDFVVAGAAHRCAYRRHRPAEHLVGEFVVDGIQPPVSLIDFIEQHPVVLGGTNLPLAEGASHGHRRLVKHHCLPFCAEVINTLLATECAIAVVALQRTVLARGKPHQRRDTRVWFDMFLE